MSEVGPRMVVSALAAIIVGVLFWSDATNGIHLLWFGSTLFVSVNSWLLIRHYRQTAIPTNMDNPGFLRKWRWVNLYLSVIWGLLWSLTPFLFFPDATLVQIFSVLLLMVVLSSTPSVTMGCYPEIYITFLTPVFCSFGYHMFQLPLDGWLHVAIVPLTWMSLVLYSVLIFKTQIEAIVLRLQLADAKEDADAANLAKTRFLAIASHDLRQSIQAASLYADHLGRVATDDTAEPVAKLQRVLQEGSRLLNYLLGMARAESRALVINTCDVDISVVENDLKTLFDASAQRKGLTFTLDLPREQLHTDPLLFRQILENLIANAIQYTSQGNVSVKGTRRGGQLQIDVRDTGPGIPQEHHANIFGEFNSLNPRGDSAGLGLFIVQRACRALNISLTLESSAGVGSCFKLQVPLNTTA
ncbi:sensor histidine kinase [Marinobacter zhejiangensis]|nr:HAMP domain-containing sensor histidine kinase [Marinobacter zhejiangensis]